MSWRPITLRLVGPVTLVITSVLTGCGHTLVFAEQTGFNLSIIAKPSEATPLNVNIGLDRTVASLVPPIHENTPQGGVDGEGVNMFAGFRANYDPGTQPLAGDLQIRTQFASGQAALAIAGSPPAVLQVVNVSGVPLFTGVVVDDTTQQRKVKINRYVRNKAATNDKTTLNAIASKLGLAPDPDIVKERNAILIEMGKRARDKTSMDELSTLLKPVTNEDF
jgi:hypothetical protein